MRSFWAEQYSWGGVTDLAGEIILALDRGGACGECPLSLGQIYIYIYIYMAAPICVVEKYTWERIEKSMAWGLGAPEARGVLWGIILFLPELANRVHLRYHGDNKIALTTLTRIRAQTAIVFDDRFPPAAIQAWPYSWRGSYCFKTWLCLI